MYPVGKRHLDKDIHKAKGGVAFLAANSGLPIVPVRIVGIEYMKGNDFWKRRKRLRVTFGKPIYFKHLSGETKLNPDKGVCEQVAVSLVEKIVKLDSKAMRN